MIDKSINKNIDRIALRLKTIPETPGVYQYLDETGKVIYVGKARNLQRRVYSYFNRYDDHTSKIKMLVRHIYDLRFTVVATEVDALLLENNLIKQYKPRYNSMLKDDKSYPYFCLTAEEFPRLLFTRNHEKVKGQFYGPYPKQMVMKELEEIIRSLFPYRTCSMPLTQRSIEQKPQRPCMKHQIGLCKAPCAGLQTHEEYLADVENVRRILKGDFADILTAMKQQMLSFADELRFEEAEVMKRKIHLLQEYQSRSTVVNTNVRDVDVVGILSDEKYAYVHMMRIKNGSIIYSFANEIRKQLDETDEEILSTIIPALHEQTESTDDSKLSDGDVFRVLHDGNDGVHGPVQIQHVQENGQVVGHETSEAHGNGDGGEQNEERHHGEECGVGEGRRAGEPVIVQEGLPGDDADFDEVRRTGCDIIEQPLPREVFPPIRHFVVNLEKKVPSFLFGFATP